MRLFAAIDLSEVARAAVAAEQKRLDAARGGVRSRVRWVKPAQLHLTLAFLGDVDEARGPSVVDAMANGLVSHAFTIAFGGVGLFPSDGAPQVVWLGVTGGARETIEAQREVADRLERIGFPREARPFRPHLTLGRWRKSAPRDRWQMPGGACPGDAAAGEVARMPVTFVTLYHSRLSPEGPTHTALVRTRLAAEP